MTNHNPRYPRTLRTGSAIAASLFLSGAFCVGAAPVFAQQAAPSAAPQTPPPLAIANPAPAKAPSVDLSAAPARPQAFQSAPSLRPASAMGSASVPQAAASAASSGQAVAPLTTTPAPSATPDTGPHWVLNVQTRPWPLVYTQPAPLNALYFSLPTEKEARFMLPGYILDKVERARFVVSEYTTNNIGSAAQIRGRQLEAFNAWFANVNAQKKILSTDPWVVYQFNQEARAIAADFKSKIQTQTQPLIVQMADDVRKAVETISPIMNVMATYEQQMLWYNVLVQLKESVSLYQARVFEADKQILDAIERFEQENPPVARPVGNPPPQLPSEINGGPTANPSAPVLTPEIKREKAVEPVRKEESSSMGGLIVLLGMGVFVVGLFLKLRNRVSSKKLPNTSVKAN